MSSTDRRTDGRTRWIQYTPPPTSLGGGIITPGNFRMIQWQEHCQKGVTDGQTDRQTEISVLRAAWSQLKILLLGTKLCQSDHYKIWCHDIRLVAELSLHAKYSLVISVTFNSLPPVAPLTKEGNLWLAKHPLVYNGHLTNHRLTPLDQGNN